MADHGRPGAKKNPQAENLLAQIISRSKTLNIENKMLKLLKRTLLSLNFFFWVPTQKKRELKVQFAPSCQ